MEETGYVKSIDGVNATIIVTRKSACEHCTAGTCSLTAEGASIEAINAAKAQVGQRVRVVLKPVAYLTGSLMIWGIPALLLLVGAVIGKELLSSFFPEADPETVAAFTAFALFALSFFAVKAWSKGAERKSQYKPVVEEILDGESQ
jgi:sigma-E factor negative regulatory protein RseC